MLNDEGQIALTLPSGQEADYNRDDLACLKRLGVDPDASTPERVLNEQYPIYLEGARCLGEADWLISPAPSLQMFKDTYETDPWFPWAEVPQQDDQKALELCPGPEPTY